MLIITGEDHPSQSGDKIRLTNIIVPSLVKPKPLPTTHALLTPETSDLSAPSSSDRETNGVTTDSETESNAGTEMSDDMGYSLEADSQGVPAEPSFEDAMAEFDLHNSTEPLSRTISASSASSSLYASSEGGSDGSGLGDSLTLPIPAAGAGGWSMVSDMGSEAGQPMRPNPLGRIQVRTTGRGWEDRPTFFEYLYGA